MAELVVVPLILGAIDWYTVATHNRRLEYVFKPATLVALIAWAALLAQAHPETWGWQAPLFLAALIFGLGGDVFLMLPDQQRFFLPGLVSFLLGQVCYIAGFSPTLPPGAALIALLPVGVIWALLFRGIARGLRARGQTKLLGPVAVYSVVLSLMLFAAWATWFRPEWGVTGRWLAAAGATLFFVSDSMLAWGRFVTPGRPGHLPVMVTYHLGQICLAATIAWHAA